jgi:hypothetical protein
MEPVPARDGVIGIAVGILLGVALTGVFRRIRARLPFRGASRRWAVVGVAAGVALLGLLLIGMYVLGQLGRQFPFAYFIGIGWVATATSGFIDAPAAGRIRRERFEADLNELKGT